jgi:LisH
MTLVKTDDPVSDLFEGLPSPDQESVHQLIYDYLIHNCYGDTAQSFRQSCGSFNTKPHSDVKTMDIDPSDQVDASGYFDEEAMDIDASQSMIIDRPSSTPGPTSTAVKTLGARKAFAKHPRHNCEFFKNYSEILSTQSRHYSGHAIGSIFTEHSTPCSGLGRE